MMGGGGVNDPAFVEKNADTAGGSFDLVGAFGEEGFGEIDEILRMVYVRHGIY